MHKERITLRLLDGSSEPSCVWHSNKRLRIGRSKKLEIPFQNNSVSRYHAEVALTGQGWTVRDAGSTNGTLVNGARVGRAEVILQEADIIQIGEISLLVEQIRSEADAVAEWRQLGIEVVETAAFSWEEVGRMPIPAEWQNSLALMTRIGRRFQALDSLDSFVQGMLWEVAELFDAPYASFILREEKSRRLRCRAHLALAEQDCPEYLTDIGLAEWLLQQDASILCRPAPHSDEQAPPAPAPNRPGSMMLGLLRASQPVGVLLLGRCPEQKPFGTPDLHLLEILTYALATSIDSFAQQFSRQRELFVQSLTALTELLHMRNTRSGHMSDKATDYALLIAEDLGVSEADKYLLKIGVPLRDLGRIGIPDALLEKPGRLTPKEMSLVQTHVAKGAAIVESIPSLAPLVPLVRSHHEHWDGNGYPDGIAGEQIPLLSRIVAVADALDAMTSVRPFREPLSPDVALAEIENRAGTQFDPACVQALVRVRSQIREILSDNRMPATLCAERGERELGATAEAAMMI